MKKTAVGRCAMLDAGMLVLLPRGTISKPLPKLESQMSEMFLGKGQLRQNPFSSTFFATLHSKPTFSDWWSSHPSEKY